MKTAEGLGEGNSAEVSRGVEQLGVCSVLRGDDSGGGLGSRLGCLEDDACFTNRPEGSLVGNLDRFGIQLVTEGDQ